MAGMNESTMVSGTEKGAADPRCFVECERGGRLLHVQVVRLRRYCQKAFAEDHPEVTSTAVDHYSKVYDGVASDLHLGELDF